MLGLIRPSSWHPPSRLGSGPLRTVRLLLARHRRTLAVCLVLAGLWITIRSAAPSPPATVAVLVAARDLPAGRTLTSEDLRPGNWPANQAPTGRLATAEGRRLASPIRAGEPVTDARVVGPGLLADQAAGTVAMPIRLGDPAAGTLVRAGDRVDVLVSSSALSSGSSSVWSSEPEPEPDLADGTDPGSGPTGTGSTGHSIGSGVAGGGGPDAERVATGALVLAAPGPGSSDDSGAGSTGGGLSGLAGGALPGAMSGNADAGLLVLAVSSTEARRLAAMQAGNYLAIAVLPER
jgi:SAF domain-containing protein